MAQMVNVDQAIVKLKKNFDQLSSAQTSKAIVSAINRTLIKGRTVARQEVKNVYNIPQKNLDGVNKINAKPGFMVGYITASAKPIPMDAFAPRFETVKSRISITKKGTQKVKDFARTKKSAALGVSIEIIKGNRAVVPYAFMLKGGKNRVFARGAYKQGNSWGFIQRHKRAQTSGNDTPIKPLVSVTVHTAVINNKAMDKISGAVGAYFPDRLEHELKYQVDRMG